MKAMTLLASATRTRHLALVLATFGGLALAGGVSGCDDDDGVEVGTNSTTGSGAVASNGDKDSEAQQASFTSESGVRTQEGATGQNTASTDGELSLEKTVPEKIVLGQNMTYTINVTNSSGGAMNGVIVREELPKGFDFDSAEPKPESSENGTLVFRMGSMADGANKQIRVTGTPQEIGTLEACTTYEFDRGVCTQFTVVNPQLQLTKTGPEGPASICIPVELTYTLTNDGDTAAQNVQVFDELPEGMMLVEGDGRTVTFDVGTLEPGQTVERKVQVMSERAQSIESYAYAKSNLDEVRSKRVAIEFIEPELNVETQAQRPFVYLGDTAEFAVTVTNNGDVPAVGTTLAASISGGEVVRVYQGQSGDAQIASGSELEIGENGASIGTLKPGESRTIYVEVDAGSEGQIQLDTVARSVCDRSGEQVATAQSAARVQVRTLSALQILVVDKQDPVQVGDQTVYEISVWNEGRADDTNLQVSAELPAGMTFVSDGSGGATDVTAEGNTVNFGTVDKIGAGDKITWYVVAKANEAAGNTQFKINVKSDNMPKAVEASEPTRLY